MARYFIAVFLVSAACYAQQYEVGADVGYGFYRSGTILSSSGTAEAGIRNRFVAGVMMVSRA